MSSTDFPSVVSPVMTAGPRRRFDSGGSASSPAPFYLPNNIGQDLYGASPPPARQAMESEYPFLQGQTGDTSMNTYAHGGAARPPHHTVAIIVPVAPASGGLSQGMPQEHPIMAELK